MFDVHDILHLAKVITVLKGLFPTLDYSIKIFAINGFNLPQDLNDHISHYNLCGRLSFVIDCFQCNFTSFCNRKERSMRTDVLDQCSKIPIRRAITITTEEDGSSLSQRKDLTISCRVVPMISDLYMKGVKWFCSVKYWFRIYLFN